MHWPQMVCVPHFIFMTSVLPTCSRTIFKYRHTNTGSSRKFIAAFLVRSLETGWCVACIGTSTSSPCPVMLTCLLELSFVTCSDVGTSLSLPVELQVIEKSVSFYKRLGPLLTNIQLLFRDLLLKVENWRIPSLNYFLL